MAEQKKKKMHGGKCKWRQSLWRAEWGAGGQEWEAQIEHAALSLFPKDFREALSAMKVRGGKQLENCCNLAGNVI